MKSLIQILEEQRARGENPTLETVHAEYMKELDQEIREVMGVVSYEKIDGEAR